MKFKKMEIDNYPTVKTGDLLEIEGKTFQVIGYTDAGTKLLIQIPGEYEVYKLVKKAKKENV